MAEAVRVRVVEPLGRDECTTVEDHDRQSCKPRNVYPWEDQPLVSQVLTVREVSRSELLSRKVKKRMWEKKTVGAMAIKFMNEDSITIATISGTGVDEWTLQDVGFNNAKLESLKQRLKDEGIILAPLTYEHEHYRQLIEQKAVIQPEVREAAGKREIDKERVAGEEREAAGEREEAGERETDEERDAGKEREAAGEREIDKKRDAGDEREEAGERETDRERDADKERDAAGERETDGEREADGERDATAIPPEYRETFAKEFVMRLENKVQGLKKAQVSTEELRAALERSRVYDSGLDKAVQFFELLASDEPKMDQWCCQLLRHTQFKATFESILQDFTAPDVPDPSIQDIDDRTSEIPDVFMGLLNIALSPYFGKLPTPACPKMPPEISLVGWCCKVIQYSNFQAEFESISRDLTESTTAQEVIDKIRHRIPEEMICVFCSALKIEGRRGFDMIPVPHYMKLIGYDSFLQCQCKTTEAFFKSPHSARECCLSMLECSPELYVKFLCIEQQLKVTGLPPGGVQDFVDNVIKHYKVPEVCLGIFVLVLGFSVTHAQPVLLTRQ